MQSAEEIRLIQSRLDTHLINHETAGLAVKESLGFIVVSRRYANKDAAIEDLQQLAARGVDDYLYIPLGDYINRISVGVFAAPGAANAQADKLNNQGFDFEVIERSRTRDFTEIIIHSTIFSTSEVERILNGEQLEPKLPSVKKPQIESPVATPEPAPIIEDSELQSVTPAPIKPKTSVPVVRTRAESSDSNWLWFLLASVLLIITGALT